MPGSAAGPPFPRCESTTTTGETTTPSRACWPGLGPRVGRQRGDSHSDNFEGTPRQTTVLDQATSALPADLQAKGFLDQALMVLGTGFGRTPRINGNDGLPALFDEIDVDALRDVDVARHG